MGHTAIQVEKCIPRAEKKETAGDFATMWKDLFLTCHTVWAIDKKPALHVELK